MTDVWCLVLPEKYFPMTTRCQRKESRCWQILLHKKFKALFSPAKLSPLTSASPPPPTLQLKNYATMQDQVNIKWKLISTPSQTIGLFSVVVLFWPVSHQNLFLRSQTGASHNLVISGCSLPLAGHALPAEWVILASVELLWVMQASVELLWVIQNLQSSSGTCRQQLQSCRVEVARTGYIRGVDKAFFVLFFCICIWK